MGSSLRIVCCMLVFVALGRANEDADAVKERQQFLGVWHFVSQDCGGKPATANDLKGVLLTFDGNRFALTRGDEVIQSGTFTVDPTRKPKTVDATVTAGRGKGSVMHGIYELDGD